MTGHKQQTKPPLVLIPCSGAKLDHPAPAGQLYTGSLHVLARRAADRIVTDHGGRVMVLSAKHGLIGLEQIVAPYDTTFSRRDPMDPPITGSQLAFDLEAAR